LSKQKDVHKMLYTKALRTITASILLVLFISAALLAENPGRNILRIVREKQGKSYKQNYENRAQTAQQLLVKKEVTTIEKKKTPEKTPSFEPFPPVAKSIETAPKPRPAIKKHPQKSFSRPKKPLEKPKQQITAADQLLRIIPAGCPFCVRINNFEYTISQLDQFLSGISPVPMGASMMVRMQLGQVLGSPALAGVNMAGNFAVFGANEAGKFYILIPVTDYQQFISGNGNLSEPDKNGVSSVTADVATNLLVTKAANYALLSTTDISENLAAMAKSISTAKKGGLADNIDADQAKRAVKEAFWIYGDVEFASKALGPAISQQLEQAMAMTQGMQLGKDLDIEACKISLSVIGKEDSQMLTAFVDGIKTMLGEPSSDQITAASKWINDAENADFAGTFNLVNLFQMAMTMQGIAEDSMPDIPTKSCVAFAGKTQDEKITLDVVLPKEQLMEMAPIVQMMMQMQMQQNQPMTPPSGQP